MNSGSDNLGVLDVIKLLIYPTKPTPFTIKLLIFAHQFTI